MFDGLYPAGDQWYWKADFVTEIPDEAVDIHVQYAEQLPTGKSTMHLYPIDGVAGRVPKDATAWNYRDAKWGMVMVGVSPDPADNPEMIAWTRAYWAALHPYSAGGAYVNMMMDATDEGQDRVRASYGEHYDRLAAIKAQVRPEQPLPGQSEHHPGVAPHPTPLPAEPRAGLLTSFGPCSLLRLCDHAGSSGTIGRHPDSREVQEVRVRSCRSARGGVCQQRGARAE